MEETYKYLHGRKIWEKDMGEGYGRKIWKRHIWEKYMRNISQRYSRAWLQKTALYDSAAD